MDFDIILKHLRITKNELTELKILNLSLSNTQQITDISALSGLINLENLYLHNTQITDISALSGLINLETLYLNNTQITDVSALYGLTKLKNLSLYNTQITDISALSGLKKLELLYLYNTQITDISALSRLKKLKILSLYYYTNNISVLSGLTKLSISGLIDIEHLRIYNKYLNPNSLVNTLKNVETLIFDTMKERTNNDL